jgi:hypothetical protein
MKKESFIFIGLFLFLAIGMHFKQWTSDPIGHLLNLPHGGAFGVPGIIHPIVFTLIIYLIIRLPFLLKKLFKRKKMKIDCD